MTYPDDYIKNNSAEFYSVIENCVNNRKHFHFIFKGVVGCGKTYLADIIKEQIKEMYGSRVSRYDANRYYSKYVKLIMSDDPDDKWLLNLVYGDMPDTSFILDDLGSEKDTQASREFYTLLIDNNYKDIKNDVCHLSIITTNLGEDEINRRYGSRAMDRLWENYTVFTFDDYSFRQRDRKIINGKQ